MTTTTAPAPTELGTDAAAAVRDIARRIANGRTITMLLEGNLASAWTALTAAGWEDVGVRDGDDGATLVDLATIAMVWGETCLPLPLIPTILTRRHSAAARDNTGPTTLSVPHPSREGGLVPFGAFPGIQLAPDLGGTAARPLVPSTGASEDLAPTLAMGRASAITSLSPEAARECAVVWGAEAVGAAARLLAEGVGYAKIREQFGKPIGSQQAVKHMLADAHALLEQAETAVLWAADEPADARRPLQFAFRSARRIGEISVQVHGGVGFTWELGLHFYLRHIMALGEATNGVLP